MGIIKKFTDLKAWEEAHALALLIYRHTEDFPKKQIYSLTDQIRRSAVSVPSNIAEGFSKNTKKDKKRYYNNSQGSLSELQAQLIIARDLRYLSEGKFIELTDQSVVVGKLLTGLVRSAVEK